MKWKYKAILQNLIAKLPGNVSLDLYYLVQVLFGTVKNPDPSAQMSAGVTIANYIHAQKQSVEGKTILEIGTGRRLRLPLALWLCGASQIITVDLNRYLKEALIYDDIAYIKTNQQQVKALFGDYSNHALFMERFEQLISEKWTLKSLLNATGIAYLAPTDATQLNLPPQNIDYQVSFTVFEHIPKDILEDILIEGKRLLKPGGLFLHLVDFSDHFSHSDNSICSINFLQFTEREWSHYAGNQYMYHNRLRVDDFIAVFREAGTSILYVDAQVDPKARQELANGFPLDNRFKTKDIETNATANAWIVAST